MDNHYPSNSDQASTQPQINYQERRVKSPVTVGEVHRKEKSTWDGVRDFFGIAECNSFRDYVSALSDITNRVYGAIDTLLGNRKYQNSTVPGARISYGTYYQNPLTASQQSTVPGQTKLQQPVYGLSYLTFDLRPDAEVVLGRMIDMLHLYQNVSIGDMYDLAGITSPNGYTDFNYGWRDLTGAHVIPYGSKYIISLPPAVSLK